MDTADFRRHGHELVDWIADYVEHVERYPVLSRAKPGDIRAALPTHAPEDGESFDAIMADFERDPTAGSGRARGIDAGIGHRQPAGHPG